MLFPRKSLALAATLISLCAATPHILIQNLSKQRICYKVEYSNGTGVFPNQTVCGATGPEIAGFWLDSGHSKGFKATGSTGQHFNGAITAVLNNNKDRGARNEINFLNPTKPFYDVDYQYGISDGTCGPPNSTNLSGERDTLGKANKAWQTLNQTMKNDLLKFPQYLRQDANGSLTYINMGVEAWPTLALEVIRFFQVTAAFNAYMGPGSQAGVSWPKNSMHEKLVALADRQVLSALTEMIVITSY